MDFVKENVAAADAAGAAPSRIIQCYCPFNLGDHVYNFFLFYHINDVLIAQNILVEYRCRVEYHDQLRDFIPPCPHGTTTPIRILPYDGDADNIGLRLHINSDHFPTTITRRPHTNFDGYYLEYYKYILDEFAIPGATTGPAMYAYTDYDLLLRYELLPAEYKDVDVLVVNSTPRSGQYVAFFPHRHIWDRYFRYLVDVKKLNVVTTEKIAGVKCTADAGLSLKNIGAISTRAKVIIGISTGPLSACFNTYALENMRRMYIFHDSNTYITPKVVKRNVIMDISTDEIYNLCRK